MYSAPELLDQVLPTKGSDMWAIGITALEVMTGEFSVYTFKIEGIRVYSVSIAFNLT